MTTPSTTTTTTSTIDRATLDGTDEEVIRCEQLTKVYPGADFAAVDHLDLAVGRGEIFGLLGPNGAGKSTTASMLTTRAIPTSGRAVVSGIDVATHPAQAKQLIGVVPQSNTLDRALTVQENLSFHGRYFGMSASASRRAADEMLELFNLTKWAKAPVMSLSGGMAQRLMVARAILHRPAVLFLDEPTAGLDPQSRIAMWEIVGRLHDEGQTIFLTTHYMEEADELCDRVAIMDHGKILALDTPEELKATTGADTVVLIVVEGDLDAFVAALRDGIDGIASLEAADGKVRLYRKGSDGLVPAIVQAAESVGATLRDLSISKPTLETVFINLTGKELRD
ncbi:MAG: daunorubicin resistance transporter ATP-binding subunit [Ilumatobacteraceae bacterium]|jgi:ABC-2 type transport system ATP-binding protein|nr:daunorubicin resistance transporter ATP-binding subunit [Ilumatobacteraceae bacterium]